MLSCCLCLVPCDVAPTACRAACDSLQDDLRYLEADEDKNLDFLAGGGASPENSLEHFPRLWCPNGTYSAHGQLFLVPLSQVGGRGRAQVGGTRARACSSRAR